MHELNSSNCWEAQTYMGPTLEDQGIQRCIFFVLDDLHPVDPPFLVNNMIHVEKCLSADTSIFTTIAYTWYCCQVSSNRYLGSG